MRWFSVFILGSLIAFAPAAERVASPAGPAAPAGAVVINPDSAYPEGPVVRDDGVFYAEMGNDRVMRFDARGNAVFWTMAGCGPTSVADRGAGRLVVLCHRRASVIELSAAGELIGEIAVDRDGQPFMTPNASISDRRGGVYFSSSGTFAPWAEAEGAVLHLDRSGELRRVAEGIHYANGVALSPDGRTLYVSEHLSRNVLAFDVAADGSLSGRRVFVALDDLVGPDPDRGWEVGPDGLAIDAAGDLFIAEYGGGRVLAVDPSAKLVATLRFPEQYVTAVALRPGERSLIVTAPETRMAPYLGKVYEIANPLSAR